MADVSHILSLKTKRKSVTVQREIPIDLDVGLLAAFDPNPIDQPEYNSAGREEYLKQSARDSIQVLVNKLFGLPTSLTDDGVVANLPASGPTTILPRSKRLPKPKPLTKWEKFSKDKGIAPKAKRDRMEFDTEKQEWVNRWGFNGKNKDPENAWIREVKPSEELTNPGLEINHAKRARKERTLKNEKQRLKNVERAATEIAKSNSTKVLEASTARPSTSLTSNNHPKKADARAAKIADHTARSKAQALAKREEQLQRKQEVEGLLSATKKSTASLGKFDKKFANEPKVKGLKRKFEPTEQSAKVERKSQQEIVDQLAKNPTAFKEKVAKKQKKSSTKSSATTEPDKSTKSLVNTRKAIRTLTGGRGATALETKPLKKGKKRP
ncbi:Rhodanese- sulfurtransferase [Puccinia graminis f. sp. tritici]|uniref:Ribosome biogenesis regulatory protein n=1 Tax=Puccinia graminis f. sp. tritici TaxID=56615 RepID=A0A5B0ND70_PUCGR|nr:Rhodanese- sulfurtransferase [Puccinia graminis f. sp. tritici]